MTEKESDFNFEFQNEMQNLGALEEKLKDEAETRLRKLAKGHTDIVGAAVSLDNLDKGSETNYAVRARVVAYVRPDNIVAVEVADNPRSALKDALTAVERQVREKREKLRETWKRPSMTEPHTHLPDSGLDEDEV